MATPTRLVGREEDARRLLGLLERDDVRVVTLTGPGGVGKTRLAYHVASRAGAPFEGVSTVPLAAVQDAGRVLPAIARNLRVAARPGEAAFASLARELAVGARLLVLDNLEHLKECGPDLGALVDECAQLTLLLTSRVRLNLRAEFRFPVLPLAVPHPGAESDLEALAGTPSVALFVQRARQVTLDFELGPSNAADIAAISRRLDGIPLAIELAAARMSLFSPAELLARLDNSFGILTDGPTDSPERLRSMAGAIGWSYRLLEPAEQSLLRALSVFFGGWTLAAAEGLLAARGEPIDTAVSGLASLIDGSLVQRIEEPGRETRFRLLETVREYGLQQLAACGEEAATHAAHAAFLFELARRAAPELDGPDQGAWLDRLEADHENLLGALDWLRSAGDAERGLQLAGYLQRFWDTRDFMTEGREQIASLLALPGAAKVSSARLRAVEADAELAMWQDETKDAINGYMRALEGWRALQDEAGVTRALYGAAMAGLLTRDFSTTDSMLEECRELADRRGDRRYGALARYLLALAAYFQGDAEEAIAGLRTALATQVEIGDRAEQVNTLGALGEIAFESGDFALAEQNWDEALAAALEVGEEWCVAWFLEQNAGILAAKGRPLAAARVLGVAAAWRTAHRAPVLGFSIVGSRPYQAARLALGDELFERELAEGALLDLEAGVALVSAERVAPAGASPASPGDAALAEQLGLTPREAEVLRLLGERLTDREIAEVLVISPRTASTHVSAILSKLDLPSRREAARFAARHGFTPPPP